MKTESPTTAATVYYTAEQRAELRAWVTASRARQGLPPTITDPGTLERVAAVLRLMAPAEPVVPAPRCPQAKPATVVTT